MDFSTAFQEYRFDCKVRKLSPKTIDNYRKQLEYLQRYLAEEHGITDVAAVRGTHIKLFLDMMDEKDRKARYMRNTVL